MDIPGGDGLRAIVVSGWSKVIRGAIHTIGCVPYLVTVATIGHVGHLPVPAESSLALPVRVVAVCYRSSVLTGGSGSWPMKPHSVRPRLPGARFVREIVLCHNSNSFSKEST